MNKKTNEIVSKLTKFEAYYTNTKYSPFVERARAFVNEQRYELAEEVLDNLPNEKELLEDMVEKLKGKSVYKRLKKTLKEGTGQDVLVALFSLGTHVLIECEQGNKEYKMLLPFIYQRIGSLLKDV